MFGIFNNLKIKFLKKELVSTIKNADNLEKNDRSLIAYRLASQINTCMQQLKGIISPSKEADFILKSLLKSTADRRRSAISSLNEKNPEWVEAALLESFIQALSGVFGEKTSDEIIIQIMSWIKNNISEKEFKNIFDKI